MHDIGLPPTEHMTLKKTARKREYHEALKKYVGESVEAVFK
jgi:hypothetical protein